MKKSYSQIKNSYRSIFIFSALLIINASVFAGSINSSLKTEAEQWMTQPKLLGFQENKGQMTDMAGQPASYVLFKTEAPNLNIWVTTSGLIYQFFKIENQERADRALEKPSPGIEEKIKGEWHRVDMILKGASIKKENIITEGNMVQGDVNYYLGHCPDGVLQVKTYTQITIREIYAGIDWVLYTSNGTLKHDFIVRPHADPNQIKLIYEGSGKLNVENNQIHFKNALGEVREGKLFCYQGNESNLISSQYTLKEIEKEANKDFSCEIGIETGKYNTEEPLIIDPQLVWGTYYGGTANDYFNGITTDGAGNVFVTGQTFSNNFPVLSAYQGAIAGSGDVFILKFSNSGVLLWATYYGGSLLDEGHGITTDSNGNIFITGRTFSNNFPVLGAFQGTNGGGLFDAFILKFTTAGGLLWATYYGGNSWDWGLSIVTDVNNDVFVAGYTSSTNFPVLNAHQAAYGGFIDAFILKFSNAGAQLWATYYGGSDDTDEGHSIATDGTSVFVTGTTYSTLFPTQPLAGAYNQAALSGASSRDSFILKFSNSGTLLWATYFGGNGNDDAQCITTGIGGNIFVVGSTTSTVFPTQFLAGAYNQVAGGGGIWDSFILKFSNSGVLLWSTYYGGNGFDFSRSIDIDECGNIFVAGNTASTDFPVLDPGCGAYFQGTNAGGNYDNIILKFSSSSALVWATYFGTPAGVDLSSSVALDVSGNVFLTGWWSDAGSNALINPGGGAHYNSSWNGGTDGYIIKFIPIRPVAISTPVNPTSCAGCNGSASVTSSCGTSPYNYLWSNGATTTNLTGLCAGSYSVVVTDAACQKDTAYLTLTASGSNITLSTNSTNANCGLNNGTASVTPNGGTNPYTYNWGNGQTTSTATGLGAGTYTATVMDANGCSNTQTFIITTSGALSVTITSTQAGCTGNNGTATVNSATGTAPFTYNWSNGQTTSAATALGGGGYTVTVTDASGCTKTETITITQSPAITVSVTTNTASCLNANGDATAFPSGGTPGFTYVWSNSQTTQTATGLAAGTYTVTISDSTGCTQTSLANISNTGSPQGNISSVINVLCSGGNTGSATVNVTVGTAPYTYSWNPSSQTTSAAIGLSAGNYVVTVTDALGCIVIVDTTITEPTAITTSATTTPTNCAGSTGIAAVAAAGGTPIAIGSSYTYLWNPSGQTTSAAIGLAAGNYTATVTDTNGCTKTATVTVSVSNNTLSVTTTSTQAGCTVNNGTATAIASNGTPNYTYSWSNGQTTSVAAALGSGSYAVTVTDANGCTQTQTVSVTSNNTLTVTTNSTQTGCTVNNGTATANASNGTPNYRYSWNNGQTTSVAAALGNGSYTVTVTDSNGCTQTQTVTVFQTPAPIVTANASPNTITAGASSSLTATGGVTYQWSPVNDLSNPNIANPTATPSQTTSYCVLVTDSNGCQDSACITITIDIPCGTIYIPNAFSPNNDSENDLECVFGNCIETFHIAIYNRWGEKVFESSDQKICWDGTYKGKLLDTAVFDYYLDATFTSGEQISRKGNVSLLR